MPRLATEPVFVYDDNNEIREIPPGKALVDMDPYEYFTRGEWDLLKKLHDRIKPLRHGDLLPRTPEGWPYIILSPEDDMAHIMSNFRSIAVLTQLIESPEELVIKISNEASEP